MRGRPKGPGDVFSPALRYGLVATAHRIGFDGTGRDGVIGYFAWLALYRPEIYATEILPGLLRSQRGPSASRPRRGHAARINRAIAAWLWLAPPPRTAGAGRPPDPEETKAAARLGGPTDVGNLLHAALRAPRKFCRLWAAAFMTPPRRLKGPDRRTARPPGRGRRAAPSRSSRRSGAAPARNAGGRRRAVRGQGGE